MNTKLLFAACAALALGACATETRLPDGSIGTSIRCGNVSQCMNKAASICAGPYEIINQQSGSSTFEGTGSTFVEMLFVCRTPPSVAKSDASLQAEIQQEILKFSQDPRYPHYQRLKLQMAEYLETGRASSLEDAYAKVCAGAGQCSAESSIKP